MSDVMSDDMSDVMSDDMSDECKMLWFHNVFIQYPNMLVDQVL